MRVRTRAFVEWKQHRRVFEADHDPAGAKRHRLQLHGILVDQLDTGADGGRIVDLVDGDGPVGGGGGVGDLHGLRNSDRRLRAESLDTAEADLTLATAGGEGLRRSEGLPASLLTCASARTNPRWRVPESSSSRDAPTWQGRES